MNNINFLFIGIFVIFVIGIITLIFYIFPEESRMTEIDPYSIFTVCHPVENNTANIHQVKGFITWTGDYCLVWGDFEGDVDYGKNKTAWTSWIIKTYSEVEVIDTSARKYQFTDIDVIAFFIKSESWVDLEKLKSRDIQLLRHEQGHFDLVEEHSRAIESTMKEELIGKIFNYDGDGNPEKLAKSNGKSKTKEIFDSFPKSQTLSDEYDFITGNGTKWNEQIDYNLRFDKLRNDP